MSKKKRPPRTTIAADRSYLRDLQKLTDFAPRNPQHSIAALLEREAKMLRSLAAEDQSRWAYQLDRDAADEDVIGFHDLMITVKDEVVTQYGRNSYALRAVGLKPKSERKRPVRRKKETR